VVVGWPSTWVVLRSPPRADAPGVGRPAFLARSALLNKDLLTVLVAVARLACSRCWAGDTVWVFKRCGYVVGRWVDRCGAWVPGLVWQVITAADRSARSNDRDGTARPDSRIGFIVSSSSVQLWAPRCSGASAPCAVWRDPRLALRTGSRGSPGWSRSLSFVEQRRSGLLHGGCLQR